MFAIHPAAKIKTLVTGSALPYLNGSSSATSAAINGFISSQLVTLPGEAQSLISLAAVVLDNYIPAPSASTVLSVDQLAYVKAFFDGLNDGASNFATASLSTVATPAKPAARAVSNAAWFNVTKK